MKRIGQISSSAGQQDDSFGARFLSLISSSFRSLLDSLSGRIRPICQHCQSEMYLVDEYTSYSDIYVLCGVQQWVCGTCGRTQEQPYQVYHVLD